MIQRKRISGNAGISAEVRSEFGAKEEFFAEIEACVAVVMVGIYFDVKMYRVSQGQRTEGRTKRYKNMEGKRKGEKEIQKKEKGKCASRENNREKIHRISKEN